MLSAKEEAALDVVLPRKPLRQEILAARYARYEQKEEREGQIGPGPGIQRQQSAVSEKD